MENHEENLNELNKEFNISLKPWLKVRSMFWGLFTEAMPQVSIAFMKIMLQLMSDSSNEPEHYLMPAIRWGNQDGELID